MRERLESLEQELHVPIWVYPAKPDMIRHGRTRLAETRELLGMPDLTVEQLAELAVVVQFTATRELGAIESLYVDDQVVNVVRLRATHSFATSATIGDVEQPVCVVVEPRVVSCLMDSLPYLVRSSEDGATALTYGPQTDAVWEAVEQAIVLSLQDDVVETLEAERRARLRDQVAEMVRSNHTNAVQRRRDNINEYERQLVSYEANVRSTLASLREQRTELDVLLRMQEEDVGETLLAEYDLLAQHPRVQSLSLEGQTLVVVTDEVRMSHPRTSETRWLGRFRVGITLPSGGVRITNLDNPRSGRDHPHVTSGDPCFGGHERDFNELIVTGRWYTFFELLLQYLSTFNPEDDWGRHAALWFDAPDADPALRPSPVEADATADTRSVVGLDDDGVELREGDRVSFQSEEYDAVDNPREEHVTGTVVGFSGDSRGFRVLRDDGDGSYHWIMDDCVNIRRMAAVTA